MIYLWKVIEAAYFKNRAEGASPISEVPITMLAPMWVLVAANIYFGTNTELTVGTAMSAARVLIQGTP